MKGSNIDGMHPSKKAHAFLAKVCLSAYIGVIVTYTILYSFSGITCSERRFHGRYLLQDTKGSRYAARPNRTVFRLDSRHYTHSLPSHIRKRSENASKLNYLLLIYIYLYTHLRKVYRWL